MLWTVLVYSGLQSTCTFQYKFISHSISLKTSKLKMKQYNIRIKFTWNSIVQDWSSPPWIHIPTFVQLPPVIARDIKMIFRFLYDLPLKTINSKFEYQMFEAQNLLTCIGVAQVLTQFWCTVAMNLIRCFGPIAKPTFHPVTLKILPAL